MGKMVRNLVTVKDEGKGADMKRYVSNLNLTHCIHADGQLVQTILDQVHLSPLPLTTQPTLWEYDHALRLYPMPTALILADKYERYELTYEGCHVFNPGRFVGGGGEFEWGMFYPSTGRSERSALSLDD
jgi:DNA polymerase epsilon subunit 2